MNAPPIERGDQVWWRSGPRSTWTTVEMALGDALSRLRVAAQSGSIEIVRILRPTLGPPVFETIYDPSITNLTSRAKRELERLVVQIRSDDAELDARSVGRKTK